MQHKSIQTLYNHLAYAINKIITKKVQAGKVSRDELKSRSEGIRVSEETGLIHTQQVETKQRQNDGNHYMKLTHIASEAASFTKYNYALDPTFGKGTYPASGETITIRNDTEENEKQLTAIINQMAIDHMIAPQSILKALEASLIQRRDIDPTEMKDERPNEQVQITEQDVQIITNTLG